MRRSCRNDWEWLGSQRHRLGVAGLAILAGALLMFEHGVIHRDTAADAFVAAAFTWTSVLAFLGYGYRHLSFCNPLLRWARDASYPIYILHQTLIVAIGYYVIQASWRPWIKYWVVLAATLASCWALYQFVVRRFSATRLIFGMKPQRSAAPRESRAPTRGEERSTVV